jgi:hypothetical protein
VVSVERVPEDGNGATDNGEGEGGSSEGEGGGDGLEPQ